MAKTFQVENNPCPGSTLFWLNDSNILFLDELSSQKSETNPRSPVITTRRISEFRRSTGRFLAGHTASGSLDNLVRANPTRKKGVPQGLSISPICLNVYLDRMLDNWWGKKFPETVLVRYADDIAIFCDTHESAVDCYVALQKRIETIGMKIKESQDEAIYDLSSGNHVDWVGFNLRCSNGEMRVRLSESSWYKLEAKLMEQKHKGESITDFDVASIGFQWLIQKALGVREAEVLVSAKRIRKLADDCGLNMSKFTDEDALEAWQTGQIVAKRAQDDVSQWLPQ